MPALPLPDTRLQSPVQAPNCVRPFGPPILVFDPTTMMPKPVLFSAALPSAFAPTMLLLTVRLVGTVSRTGGLLNVPACELMPVPLLPEITFATMVTFGTVTVTPAPFVVADRPL